MRLENKAQAPVEVESRAHQDHILCSLAGEANAFLPTYSGARSRSGFAGSLSGNVAYHEAIDDLALQGVGDPVDGIKAWDAMVAG